MKMIEKMSGDSGSYEFDEQEFNKLAKIGTITIVGMTAIVVGGAVLITKAITNAITE